MIEKVKTNSHVVQGRTQVLGVQRCIPFFIRILFTTEIDVKLKCVTDKF